MGGHQKSSYKGRSDTSSSSHLILQTCCPLGVENLACMPTLSLSLTIFSPQRTQLALLLGDDSSLSNFLRLPPGDTGGLLVFHNGLFQLLMVIVVAWVRAAIRGSHQCSLATRSMSVVKYFVL